MVECQIDIHGTCHRATHHGVIANAQESHHLYVGRYGAGSCKLSVGVHTSQRVCHAIAGRTGCHVVGMKSAASTASAGYREIWFACADALFLVCACHGMLEAGGVGRVTRDAHVHILFPQDGHAFAYIVGTITVPCRTRSLAVGNTLYFLQFAREIVTLSLYLRKTVEAADDHGCVFPQTVQNAAQGLVGWS